MEFRPDLTFPATINGRKREIPCIISGVMGWERRSEPMTCSTSKTAPSAAPAKAGPDGKPVRGVCAFLNDANVVY